MNLIKKLIILPLVSLLFAGCLQVETNVHVNKDGSGTIHEKVLMSKTFVDMLKGFAQSFDDSASTEEFTLFTEEEIKGNAINYGENINYVSHEFVSNDNWEGYIAEFSFKDITNVKLTPDPDTKVDAVMSEGSSEEGDYYFFKFQKEETSELIIDRPEINFEESNEDEFEQQEAEQENEEGGDEFLSMMEGMSINISVEVDGNIINTNANYVESSKITLLQMDFSEMMKNKEEFKKFKNREPKNIEEMKEFLEKFPGMKVEIQKPVTIKFQ